MLGDNIEYLFIRSGKTVKALCAEIGISYPTYTRIITTHNANTETLKRISDYFGVSLASLFEEKTNEHLSNAKIEEKSTKKEQESYHLKDDFIKQLTDTIEYMRDETKFLREELRQARRREDDLIARFGGGTSPKDSEHAAQNAPVLAGGAKDAANGGRAVCSTSVWA